MSSTVVPWPGSRGSSTAKPAAANAFATRRIDVGLPVKPWMQSAPAGPPSLDHRSAPGIRSVMWCSESSGVGVVVGQGLVPPLGGVAGLLPLGERVDAVHRARWQTLVAPRAQLGQDHHVGTVVEDRPELRRAVAQA